jgi:hypothetical protein
MATPAVKEFVQRQFERLALRQNITTIVEKTCANSLRPGFVAEIFPEARFVHIVRDGRDVAHSAAQRWNAPLDWSYILKKARFVPWQDLPYYGLKYIGNRIHRLVSGKRRLSMWGPKFTGMSDALEQHPLPVACALQWAACVKKSQLDLAQIPDAQQFTLSYEQFAADPPRLIRELGGFLGVNITESQSARITSSVTDRSVGKWRNKLTAADIATIDKLTGPLLDHLGYELSFPASK